MAPRSFVRDAGFGHVYVILRREIDGLIVRAWVHPDSALALVVPATVLAVPTLELATLPLDDRYPVPDMLVRRFDGSDDRVFSYDAGLGFWRQVADAATFQVLGFHWCNVLVADSGFWERATIGVPHPPTSLPAWVDYPACNTLGVVA